MTSDRFTPSFRFKSKYQVEASGDVIYYRDHVENGEIKTFINFIKANGNKKIIIDSVLSIDSLLTITNLLNVLTLCKDYNVTLEVIEYEKSDKIDSRDFLDIIYYIAMIDRESLKKRTSKGLEVAREKGRIGGRPSISTEIIEKIGYLYHEKNLTCREISKALDISLGSVSKYKDFPRGN